MMTRFPTGRHAGVLVPLFSIPSTRSWGIGEIGDIEPFAAWLREAGHDMCQILPVNEMAEGEHSPYFSLSAMAIDPIFISLQAVEEFEALGGEESLEPAGRKTLAALRASATVEYTIVRALKGAALRTCFDEFEAVHWRRDTPRAAAFREYVSRESWWLDDYALFRTLQASRPGQSWTDWAPGLRRRAPKAIAGVRAELEREIRFRQYLQWLAGTQWRNAREAAREVRIFGDLPFMVSRDSADIWARQHEFRLDASVGTPPDAFSKTGQDWGVPVYRWDVIQESGFAWLRQRARRSAALYDGYRVDHLVGFYRTYVRPHDGSEPFFVPETDAEQLELGERVLEIFRGAGAEIIAEDLGTVPDFVRESLARLNVPGYRVLRWEREWKQPGQPFRDPADWSPVSIATSGTHDTEPLAVWWEQALPEERQALARVPTLERLGLEKGPFTPAIRDVLLEALYGSGSNLLVLPVQDVFGWRDQINVPATYGDTNWVYRLPWPVDTLGRQPVAVERAQALRSLAARHRRGAFGE